MSSKSKLNQVVFFNLLGPIILNGIHFLTIPIFTRLLGTENYGIYTVYASYQTLLTIIMSVQSHSGISTTYIYYTDPAERNKCFSNALTISLVSCFFVSLLILVFIGPVSSFTELSPIMILILLIHCIGVTGAQFALSDFTYTKKAKTNFIFSILISLSSVSLSLLFITNLLKNQKSYLGYALGHAIPYTVIGFSFLAYYLLKGKSFFSKKEWSFYLPLCLPIVFHGLSNTVLHQCDKVMLQKLTTASFAGIYGFAVSFANVINIIINAFNTTWVPFYHDDIRENKTVELKRKTNNYVFLVTCLSIGFTMAMPEVVKIFAQKDFWFSIKIIPVLVLGFFFSFLYTFPVNFEFYYKKTKNIAIGTTSACIVNIVLNYLFINWFGMMGAAFATLVSYAALYLFHLIIVKFVIKEEYHYPYKFFYAYLAVAVVFTALFYIIADLPLVRWFIFAIAAVLILLRVFKNKSIF